MKKGKRTPKINFLLENEHYRKLHLALYLVTVGIIALFYLFFILFLSNVSQNFYFTAILSVVLGIFLVYNRDNLVKKISEHLEDKRRKKIKRENKSGLKTTLRKITPKEKKIKFTIKGNKTPKEKISKFKNSFKSKKNKDKYVEIK